MEVELQSQLAFHLTGNRPGAGLDAVEPLALRPALLARYHDLTTLRYDFPVVLIENGSGDANVQALSGIIDDILHEVAQGDDGERITRHLLRLEQQIRTLVAQGRRGSLSALWDAACERLGVRAAPLLENSLARARAALKIDGELLDCDAALAPKLLKHAWSAVQEQKARRFRADIRRLIQNLSDILKADFARSEAGRSAERLEASVGAVHSEVFDFSAMSRMLGRTSSQPALPPARRQRIVALLDVLESQKFYPGPAQTSIVVQPYSFVFDNCVGALAAYRERLPALIALAKAMAMAELEIAGEFKESMHHVFFERFGDDGLDPNEMALFPDYLVCANARKLDAFESSTLMEILSSGLPMKVMVQSDDILAAQANGHGDLGFGMRSQQLAKMAIGLNAVYVMQSCSANLFQFRGRVNAGIACGGPALFSVFSGASATVGDLPPYLAAAAAMVSRAFPAFSYDPSAGADWASRFDLEGNPQVELDWPVYGFACEDQAHQTVSGDVAFTLVDFLSCDSRYARHLARVPRSRWSANMIPAGECLAREASGVSDGIPYLLTVDSDNTLHRVIVDDKLMREARRCRDMWHSLQELGGIHNSHAERLLARERKSREESGRGEADVRETSSAVAAPTAAPIPAVADVTPETPSDDAYIETARCTSCNECTNINDKMFGYNENKQAYIADATAGTYAQLVEAAESCQVSIIHPGKPRNSNEHGLDELMRRAESFR